jgi:hypothetical protein
MKFQGFQIAVFFQKKMVPQSFGLALKMVAAGPSETLVSIMVLIDHLISDH